MAQGKLWIQRNTWCISRIQNEALRRKNRRWTERCFRVSPNLEGQLRVVVREHREIGCGSSGGRVAAAVSGSSRRSVGIAAIGVAAVGGTALAGALAFAKVDVVRYDFSRAALVAFLVGQLLIWSRPETTIMEPLVKYLETNSPV